MTTLRNGGLRARSSLLALGVALMPTLVWGQAETQPNILFIIADDMGLDASACYTVGAQQAPMPNLERLCADGLVFENAYANPVCSPTRAAMLTGAYGFRTGIGGAIPRDGGQGLDPDTVSLFDVMTEAGYSSALIGKWHVAGSDDGLEHPAALGVPEYFGLYRGGIPDYFQWQGVENGVEVDVDGYSTTVLTDRAIDWIGAQGADSPWFLWLAYNAPHAPFHVPPDDLHSAEGLPDDPAVIAEDPLPYYNAMLEALDTELGRLLAAVPPEDHAQTYVVFIGDNGTPNQVAADLYPGTWAKGSIYDGGTHVPLIVAGPGVAQGRADGFVTATDIFATFASLAGAEVDAPDSVSFAPMLFGEPGAREVIYAEHFQDAEPRGRNSLGWSLRYGSHWLVTDEAAGERLFELQDGRLVEQDPLAMPDLLQDLRARAEDLRGGIE